MADKIVAEYTVKVDGALKNLDKLAARVDNIDKERKQTQKGFKEMSSSLSSSFAKVGAAIGVAFGTQQIVQFGKEAVTLAAKAEGIERAFAKLNNPRLLDDLRRATRGTVSDLQLMQQAVRAQNFKVPLEQLAGFFKFATNRAIETGESVDYLVNSIIDGIGRKSTLVLDNLGISATELQEEIKKTGDFGEAAGNIIARELEKAGDVADTTATKIAQLNTALENTKAAAGKGLIDGVSDLGTELGETADAMKDLAGEADGATLAAQVFEKIVQTVALPIRALNGYIKTQVDLLIFWKNTLGITSEEAEETTSIAEGLAGIFAFMNKQLSSGGEGGGVINNIVRLNNQLKELKKDLSEAAIGGSEFFDITEDIADKTKELNEAIAQTKLQDAFKLDSDDPFSAIGDGLVDMEEGTEEATTAATDAWNEHFNELMAGQDAAFNNDRANREQSFNEWQQYITQISGLANSFSRLQRALGDQELANIRNQLDQGQITREEYDVKRRELLSKQAEEEKQFAIFDATINGAVAIVNAFKDGGPILAALVAAGVAAEIAIIAARPTPQFAEGGWVDEKTGKIHGRSHAHGGVKIEAEGDEFITKGKYAKPNAAILEAINTGNWEKYKMENIITPAINQVLDGGFENMGASYMLNNSFNDKNMLFATDRLRKSNRMDAQYIVSQLRPKLRKRGNYA